MDKDKHTSKDTDAMTNNANPAWNRFDRISVVSYIGSSDRMPALENEFHRIGISDFHISHDFPNPYRRFLWKSMLRQNLLSNYVKDAEKAFYITIGHYTQIAHAFHSNVKNILIFEDDVCFLKDESRVAAIVSSLPDDFDFAFLDHFPSIYHTTLNAQYKAILAKAHAENKNWAKINSPVKFRSSAAYALSRQGMKRLLDLMDMPFAEHPKIKTLHQIDWYNEYNILVPPQGHHPLNIYMSVVQPAMQRIPTGAANSNPETIDVATKERETLVQRSEYNT